MLLYLPSEIIVKIVHFLSLPDRFRLGATCEFLYDLVNEAGRIFFDQVKISLDDHFNPKVLVFIGGQSYVFLEDVLNGIRPIRPSNIFKNASIGCLDLQGIRSWPVLFKFQQTIKSATYERLKLGINSRKFRKFRQTITFQGLVAMFVNNVNFKREFLDLSRYPTGSKAAQDNFMVLRNLPPMKRLDMVSSNIDSTTLLVLVGKIDNINFGGNQCDDQTLLQVFRVVCVSTQDRRIQIPADREHFKSLVIRLESDIRYIKESEGWWRDRESGAVMFCGDTFAVVQELTFFKSSIGYEGADNGDPCYSPRYYRPGLY